MYLENKHLPAPPHGKAPHRKSLYENFVILIPPIIEKLINRENCTMVYKSLNKLAPENLGNIFSKLSDVHTRVLRNTKCNLAVPKMRTAYGQKSFAFRGANAWNKLDSEVKLAPSIQSFITKLKALN